MIGRTNVGGGGGGSSKMPSYTYTGSCTPITDENGWRLKFFTSGTLTLQRKVSVDVFCVGGGGAGRHGTSSVGGGGGGGYVTTSTNIALAAGTYEIVVGEGAAVGETQGGTTSAFGVSVAGGYSAGSDLKGGNGGSGGGGGGSTNSTQTGGSDGSDGGDFNTGTTFRAGGKGQGNTTREFGEADGTLYAGGGGGSNVNGNSAGGDGGGGTGGGENSSGTVWAATDGEAGTGGGGGGYYMRNASKGYTAGAGGSGIVVIRNAR